MILQLFENSCHGNKENLWLCLNVIFTPLHKIREVLKTDQTYNKISKISEVLKTDQTYNKISKISEVLKTEPNI